MRTQDVVVLALTAWRENRGGGGVGMRSVMNVILNRMAQRKTSAWVECLRPWQFSSMTAHGDPELGLWPADEDAEWILALDLAETAARGQLYDATGGATLYYAPHGIGEMGKTITLPDGTVLPFPASWNEAAVKYTATIADQVFFREV